MRLTAVLLVAGMLLTAGCFGKDDDNGDDGTTTPTPTGATPTGPTPTGATPTTTPTSPTAPTAPVALAPREVCTITFSFQQPPPAPPGTPFPATTCTVPAGYRTLTFQGNFTSTTPAGPGLVPQGVKIDLIDPAAAVAVSCALAGPTIDGAVACSQATSSAAAGDWKLQPSGSGAAQFSGSVIAS